ncbi:MAG: hypothetical protein AMK72_02660 [Planctomycetes bacterium SM23_25]|nr:MAG: hypothetical protein AMK72_02660 [Planctomycetes bacterium SM23_25]
MLGARVQLGAAWLLGWGLSGAVMSISLGWLTTWAGITIAALRTIRLPTWRLLWQGYLQAILAAVPAAGLAWGLQHYFPITGWWWLAGVCAAALGTFGLLFVPHVTDKEWETVRSGLRRIRGALRPQTSAN